ncbi:MAG: NADH-quinone oxidoreductase subunit A [Pirellulales bacterium]|nr:NADH-quinone oxidoreductase subunit A [Pirellulales bacterium]
MITTSIVAHLVLFIALAFAFLFVALLLGWFLRAKNPTRVKSEIYECGEHAVGTSQVRFDLRFYVVALVFLVFDVEVAFFFPWATVFGDATDLMNPNRPKMVVAEDTGAKQWSPEIQSDLRGLGLTKPELPPATEANALTFQQDGRKLALTAMADVGVFFAVLLVGFIYVWYRGDLDWVRAIARTPRQEEG